MFSEEYSSWRRKSSGLGETGKAIPEFIIQDFWGGGGCTGRMLQTLEGHRIEVLAPGWRNRTEGPDFLNAQIFFNGSLHRGDVEIHRTPAEWKAHGHHEDSRYNQVILHVVVQVSDKEKGGGNVITASGREIATLRIPEEIIHHATENTSDENIQAASGGCVSSSSEERREHLLAIVQLAASWRMVGKAHRMAERSLQVGIDQTVYEILMQACGYSRFSGHFQMLARALPYDRARQLARQDPKRLETALLHLAGLLPEKPQEAMEESVRHYYDQLAMLRAEHFAGLRILPMDWPMNGVRPLNRPERRIAGISRIIARTAADGLAGQIYRIWRDPLSPAARRKALEEMFRIPSGFWGYHCRWTGNALRRPAALIGTDRIRVIIGNLCIPYGIMQARHERQASIEEGVFTLFKHFPAAASNRIEQRMLERLFHPPFPRLNFSLQQGLIQLYQDWCRDNGACSFCPIAHYMEEAVFTGKSRG